MSIVIWDGTTLSADTRAWIKHPFKEVSGYSPEDASLIKKLLGDGTHHDFSLQSNYHQSRDNNRKISLRTGLLADGLKVKAIGCTGALELLEIINKLPNGTDLADYINNPFRGYEGKILAVTQNELILITNYVDEFVVKHVKKNVVISMGSGVLPALPYAPGFMTAAELVKVSCYMSTAQGGQVETWCGKGRSLQTEPVGEVRIDLIKKYFDHVLALKKE